MAITVVQHPHDQNINNSNDVGITVTSTTAGALVIAVLLNKGGRTITGITGNTFVQASNAASTRTSGNYGIDIYYCLAGTGGLTTFTGTFSGVAGTYGKGIAIIEVTPNSGNIWAFDSGNHINDGSADPELGPSLTPSTTSSFLIAGYLSNNNCTGATVWTSVADANTDGAKLGSWGIAGLITTSMSATAASFTDGGAGNGYCTSAAGFKEVASSSKASKVYHNQLRQRR